MSMYGTRDAALNWAMEYGETLRAAGYIQGKSNPCLFHRKAIGVSVMVHGSLPLTGFGSAGRSNLALLARVSFCWRSLAPCVC